MINWIKSDGGGGGGVGVLNSDLGWKKVRSCYLHRLVDVGMPCLKFFYQRMIEIREGAVALKAAHCVLIKHFKSFLFFNGITVRCSSSSSSSSYSLVMWLRLSLAKAFLMGRVFIRGNLETPPILPSPPQSSFLTLPWILILLLLFWVGGWLVGGVFADGII